jgi:hypothetical protein
MRISYHRMSALVVLAASTALLAPAAALASTNRTGLPMYPGATGTWAPDSDAQFTCHEYHAVTQNAAATVVNWYHSRYSGAHMKRAKVGFYDNSTVIAINPNKEIVVSPPYNKSSSQTQIVLYGGTQCPIL